MSLLRLNQVSLSYAEKPLLDNVSLTVHPKDRIAILGRNGVGKSTLLKLIQGKIKPDSGQIEHAPSLTMAELQQSVPRNLAGNIFDFVSSSTAHEHDWEITHRVEKVISQMGLDPNALLAELSGGQIRRALLARALVNDPDILLLDEPTNHLDLESIQWLEKFLNQAYKTIIFITHDRVFLQKIATRIVEIDRGRLIDWNGDYAGFLVHKEQQLAAEETLNAKFDKKLAQEEVWIRQGVKARRTRNEGRVRALEGMRRERQDRRSREGNLKLEQQNISQSGKQVFIAEHIHVQFNDKTIIQDFSTIILRGDKIGIIGPNGCGKSTLLSVLLGKLAPTHGSVQHGTKLEIAYFDQHRSILDPESIVQDNVSSGHQSVMFNGASKHVISYLQDFLFTPEKARSKVKVLSGGECNRLLLAKLFAEPSNVLVLDEPTNDLDLESLDLLEEYLLEYQGTVLLVSHDRALLDHVVTSTVVFEGNGVVNEYVGGYEDWIRQSKKTIFSQPKTEKFKSASSPIQAQQKITAKEKQELEQLPDQIAALEKEMESQQLTLADPTFYKQSTTLITAKQNTLAELQSKLQKKYERWEILLTKGSQQSVGDS